MAPRSRRCPFLFTVFALVALAFPAQAQTPASKPYATLFVVSGVDTIENDMPRVAMPLSAAVAAQSVPAPQPLPDRRRSSSQRLLPAMYLSFGTLQALDAHSTFRALDAGHVESNPLMRWSTSHPAAFVSMKAAATAGTIYVTERIARKHPKRAMVFMAAINAAYAAIVFHNYRVPVR